MEATHRPQRSAPEVGIHRHCQRNGNNKGGLRWRVGTLRHKAALRIARDGYQAMNNCLCQAKLSCQQKVQPHLH